VAELAWRKTRAARALLERTITPSTSGRASTRSSAGPSFNDTPIARALPARLSSSIWRYRSTSWRAGAQWIW
jgi:hypothetical protein